MDNFKDNQGVINGRITQLANKPEELKEFMEDKTEEQKRQGRIHLKMIKSLKRLTSLPERSVI